VSLLSVLKLRVRLRGGDLQRCGKNTLDAMLADIAQRAAPIPDNPVCGPPWLPASTGHQDEC
jgi:hypothetical protein